MKVTSEQLFISGEQSKCEYANGEQSSHLIGTKGKNKPYDYITGKFIKEENKELLDE